VRIAIAGSHDGRVLLRHYRIDETHSNAWTAWKKMGSPQQPSIPYPIIVDVLLFVQRVGRLQPLHCALGLA
jgi:beta-xylosidase